MNGCPHPFPFALLLPLLILDCSWPPSPIPLSVSYVIPTTLSLSFPLSLLGLAISIYLFIYLSLYLSLLSDVFIVAISPDATRCCPCGRIHLFFTGTETALHAVPAERFNERFYSFSDLFAFRFAFDPSPRLLCSLRSSVSSVFAGSPRTSFARTTSLLSRQQYARINPSRCFLLISPHCGAIKRREEST